MKDKKPLVLQEEYGKDEDGTQVNGKITTTHTYIIITIIITIISNPSL